MINLNYVIYRKMTNLDYAIYHYINRWSGLKHAGCTRTPILLSLMTLFCNGSLVIMCLPLLICCFHFCGTVSITLNQDKKC